MATATDSVLAEPITFPVVPTPAIPLRAHRRYHWTKWALAVGLIIALAVVGELWRIHSQNAITYQSVPLERGTVQASVTATGTLNAVVDVQVGSQVSGNIKALYADFNTKVTKGQLVALIDPELFQTQVDQAQAALSSAQSAVLSAGAQVQKATSDLSGTVASERSAESVIAKDRAAALNAGNQWERVEPLFKKGIILSVPCTTCGAAVGEVCELHTGAARTEPHRDRKLSAAEAVERNPANDNSRRSERRSFA